MSFNLYHCFLATGIFDYSELADIKIFDFE